MHMCACACAHTHTHTHTHTLSLSNFLLARITNARELNTVHCFMAPSTILQVYQVLHVAPTLLLLLCLRFGKHRDAHRPQLHRYPTALLSQLPRASTQTSSYPLRPPPSQCTPCQEHGQETRALPHCVENKLSPLTAHHHSVLLLSVVLSASKLSTHTRTHTHASSTLGTGYNHRDPLAGGDEILRFLSTALLPLTLNTRRAMTPKKPVLSQRVFLEENTGG